MQPADFVATWLSRAPQVAQEIWLCDERKVTVWKGDIRSYKKMLAKKMGISH